jgi:uncharacterized protein (DUF1778 family)
MRLLWWCVDIVHTLPYSGCLYRRKAMRNTSTTERAGRGVTINLRADEVKRALIDRAAERLGKNRSEFMLEAACRAATAVLLDQRWLVRTAAVWESRPAAGRRSAPRNT